MSYLRLIRWVLLPALLSSAVLFAQGRKINRIPRETKPAPGRPAPPASACHAAVRTVADAYGDPERLRRVLHAEFPNREEFVDATRRADTRVTNVRLEVESIESTKYTPWTAEGTTDCIADVRARLVFENPTTGERTVRDAGRGEWRLRFNAGASR